LGEELEVEGEEDVVWLCWLAFEACGTGNSDDSEYWNSFNCFGQFKISFFEPSMSR